MSNHRNLLFNGDELTKVQQLKTYNLTEREKDREKTRIEYLNDIGNKVLTEEERLEKLAMGPEYPQRLSQMNVIYEKLLNGTEVEKEAINSILKTQQLVNAYRKGGSNPVPVAGVAPLNPMAAPAATGPAAGVLNPAMSNQNYARKPYIPRSNRVRK